MPLFALLWTESQSKWVHWCRLLEKYNAGLVQPKNVEELVSRLGNPLYFVVNQPDEAIEQNIVPGKSNEIPPEAFHLVLLNTYFCQIPNQPCKYNVLEINVLGSGGGEVPGYERTLLSGAQGSKLDNKALQTEREKEACLVSNANSNGGSADDGVVRTSNSNIPIVLRINIKARNGRLLNLWLVRVLHCFVYGIYEVPVVTILGRLCHVSDMY
jgi:hypothetical protein